MSSHKMGTVVPVLDEENGCGWFAVRSKDCQSLDGERKQKS